MSKNKPHALSIAINIKVTFEEALRIIKSRWRCAVKWLRYRLLSRPDRCNCTEQSNVGACREDYISLFFALLGPNELLGPHLLRYPKKYVLWFWTCQSDIIFVPKYPLNFMANLIETCSLDRISYNTIYKCTIGSIMTWSLMLGLSRGKSILTHPSSNLPW